jgi:hypothetical protein
MLIVRGTEEASEGQLKLDNLVLSVEWLTTASDPPLYWRTGNFRNALFEIGLHPRTGRLISATLVLIPKLVTWPSDAKSLEDITHPKERGVPLFDLAHWQNDGQFVDEPNDLRVHLGTERLAIEWGDQPAPTRCIQSGRILFGVDERDALTTIQIKNLSEEEISAIREVFTA